MGEPLLFGPGLADGDSELGGATQQAFNVTVDGGGVVRRRPCLTSSSLAPETAVFGGEVTGLYVSDSSEVYAVEGAAALRKVYRVTPSGLTELGEPLLAGGKRPTFAETEAILAIAAGGAPLKVVFPGGVGALSAIGGGPPDSTHVIAHGARLLSNNTAAKGRVNYSGQAAGSSYAGHEVWNSVAGGSGFFEAEARPDRLVALHENTNELFLFGTSTLQVWVPDATYRYVPGATREFGCSAPYSIVKKDQAFAWLDHTRRFVMSDGRTYETISSSIQQTLNDMSTVDDCFGFWFREGPVDALVWVFPTDGRTFAFQIGGGWSTWAGWAGTNWAAFNVRSHFLVPGSATNLVGTIDGKVGRLSRGASSDYGADVVARVRTGFVNRGTSSIKQCMQLLVKLRRGAATSSVAHLRWRDRPDSPWDAQIPIDLGDYSDREFVVPLRSLGTYRERQWEFEFSGDPTLELVGAEEDFYVTGVS